MNYTLSYNNEPVFLKSQVYIICSFYEIGRQNLELRSDIAFDWALRMMDCFEKSNYNEPWKELPKCVEAFYQNYLKENLYLKMEYR